MNKGKLCLVEECGYLATATIYCQMHYRRLRLYGDVNYTKTIQRRQNEISIVNVVKLGEEHEWYGEVKLTQGKIAIIDIADVELVEQYNWYYSSSTGYAYSGKIGTSMQQFLIGKAPTGYEIGHEDRDKLNNRRGNIKFVTYSENHKNTAESDNAGISFHAPSWKWQAYLWEQGQRAQIYLGVYKTKKEAIKARKIAEILRPAYNSSIEFKTAWKIMRKGKHTS